MEREKIQQKCLKCKDNIQRKNNPFFPFCSQRCKDVDLGRWFKEEYKISGEMVNIEEQSVSKEES